MRVSELGLRGKHSTSSGFLAITSAPRAAGVASGSGQVETIFSFARPLVTLAQVDFWSFLGVFLAVPAYAYAVAHLRRRPEPLPVYIMAFISIWALWWILLNYDLPEQHILFILPFIQIYVAKLLIDGYQALSRVNNGSASRILARCGLAAIALIIVGKTFLPFLQIVDSIGLGSRTLTPAYREFVTFVDENTEPNAIFSGWTWSSPWWLSIETRIARSRTAPGTRSSSGSPSRVFRHYPGMAHRREAPQRGLGPNMSYASRWGYEQNEKRRDFAEHHCTHLLTTGDEHQWTIYRINPLPAGAVE